MRHRVAAFSRPLAACTALLLIAAQATAVHAQATLPTLQPPAQQSQQDIRPKFQPVAGAADAIEKTTGPAASPCHSSRVAGC